MCIPYLLVITLLYATSPAPDNSIALSLSTLRDRVALSEPLTIALTVTD